MDHLLNHLYPCLYAHIPKRRYLYFIKFSSVTTDKNVKQLLIYPGAFPTSIFFIVFGENNIHFGEYLVWMCRHVYTKLKQSMIDSMEGVDCLVHIFQNVVQMVSNVLPTGIEVIVMKFFSSFSNYMLCTEQLKCFHNSYHYFSFSYIRKPFHSF